jgi:threonine dehydrogenase-like Zn-dependent dehydrogenase
MRAVRRDDTGLTVVDVPARQPGPGEVRVRVRSAGICGSDLHAVTIGPVPSTLGHEVAGVTDDGMPVAIWPLTPCGSCDRCMRGEVQQCRGAQWNIYGYGRDGGMADEIVVEPANLVPLAWSVPVTDACLVEPLACAIHGTRRAGLRPEDRVAVVGGGTMGLCFVAAARWSGCRVDLEARHERQRLAGEMLGASIGSSGQYDVVVDAAGTAAATNGAVGLCHPGATLLLLATYWEGIHLDPLDFAMNEITLVPASAHGRHQGGRDVDSAAALLAAQPSIAGALITHRFPIADAVEAFRVAADRRSGAIKVVLQPD